MAAAGINASTDTWCYRTSEYRMRAGSVAGYQRLDRLAGAIRFVWNYLLSDSSTLRQKRTARGSLVPLRGNSPGVLRSCGMTP
ncbi:MAG: hypothetical protein OXU68_06645, partial [Bacteroidota bacterium]|nr:hypothetical protein [Bacteroidota bacterium]